MYGPNSLQSRATILSHRRALEAELANGAETERLSKNYKLRRITMSFNSTRSGLQFTPPPKSGHGSTMLFTDVTGLQMLPPKSAIHQRAGLGPFKYCLKVSFRTGTVWYLVSSTNMDLNAWYELFAFYVDKYRTTQRRDPMSVFIAAKWASARKQQPDSASFSEIVDIILKTFGEVPASQIEERFKIFDRDKNVRIDYEEFVELFRSFCEYPELRPLFASLVQDERSGMTRAEFTRFLFMQGDLGEASSSSGDFALRDGSFSSSMSAFSQALTMNSSPLLSSTYANYLFDSLGLLPDGYLSFDGFVEFLFSAKYNSAIDPRHRRCVDSMRHPLKDYYICSSHNTYLSGDQIRSSSSTDRYRDVLQAGCRCVEIDCWNGPDGDPVVYHGHTATSKIRFEDVINTIRQYAFQPPPPNDSIVSVGGVVRSVWNPRVFPVILSLEVHTSDTQSDTMARMLRRTFGEDLLLPGTIAANNFTPENLKEKILVKWKASEADDDDTKDKSGSGINRDRAEEPTRHSSSELTSCVTVRSVKTKSWGADATPTSVQSYVEWVVESFYKSNPREFAIQNTRMLSRVYPAGRRVNSGNYDPLPAWRLGAHMVALNFQTRDRHMQANTAFFSHQNGGCGYVLKPLHLRDPSPSGSVSDLLERSNPYVLTIDVLSGAHLGEAFLGDRETGRRVRLWLHGSEEDECSTPIVVGNSFHPVWSTTVKLRGGHRDLDLLCVQLCVSASPNSEGRTEVGEETIPVRTLRSGYRSILLKHPRTGIPFDFAAILCRIAFSPPASPTS